MIENYPLPSQLINNKLLIAYENLVYLLGQEIPNQTHFSGLYEILETSGTMIINSGIFPSVKMTDVLTSLKFDYIYRKHYNQIKYGE